MNKRLMHTRERQMYRTSHAKVCKEIRRIVLQRQWFLINHGWIYCKSPLHPIFDLILLSEYEIDDIYVDVGESMYSNIQSINTDKIIYTFRCYLLHFWVTTFHTKWLCTADVWIVLITAKVVTKMEKNFDNINEFRTSK